MAKLTQPTTSAAIDEQLAGVQEQRETFERELAAVETALGQAIAAGKDTSDLEQHHSRISARLRGLPSLLNTLTTARQDAEAAEALKAYEQHTADLHNIYTKIKAVDDELAALADRRKALLEQRADLETQTQRLHGRRLKLQPLISKHRLNSAIALIHKRYRIEKYM